MALDINVSIACSVVLYDMPSSVKEYVHIKADFSAFTHHTSQSSQSSGFRAQLVSALARSEICSPVICKHGVQAVRIVWPTPPCCSVAEHLLLRCRWATVCSATVDWLAYFEVICEISRTYTLSVLRNDPTV